jgi:hypothetical protein
MVWKRVVTSRPEGGEKERGRENRQEIHVFWPDLSLYSCHRSGRAWVLAESDLICQPTHVHRRRFDKSDRKITLYSREIPSLVPFPLTIQILSPVFKCWPERERRARERALRERWFFFGERKKNDGFVLKRKKQENKKKKKEERKQEKQMVTDGFKKTVSKFT